MRGGSPVTSTAPERFLVASGSHSDANKTKACKLRKSSAKVSTGAEEYRRSRWCFLSRKVERPPSTAMRLVIRNDVLQRAIGQSGPGWWFSHWFGAGDRPPSITHQSDNAEHEQRALQLLKANLSPEQLQQYEATASFDVIGGATGRHYRIVHGSQLNVHLLDKHGRWLTSLCFVPRGRLPVGDVMLAQKIALELFELDVIRVANRSWPPVRF